MKSEKQYRQSPEGKVKRQAARAKRFALRRQYVYEYLLQHPCKSCEEKDPIVLQFHHRDPVMKAKDISSLIGDDMCSMDRLKAEILKCDILCANCHLRHHAKENKTFKYRSELLTDVPVVFSAS